MRKEVQKIKFGLFERNFALLNVSSKFLQVALKKIFLKSSSPEHFLKITQEFSELKGSLMKAGQLLSLYGEAFLPEEAIKMLNQLQDQSSYVSFRTLKKSQGPREKEILKQFKIKDKPFASASIGQVHLGTHVETQKEYAIKIQYPKIEKSIDMDLFVLKAFLSTFKMLPKKLKLKDLFEEIKKVLKKEVDYISERKYQQIYERNLKEDYIIPKSFAKYSGKTILVSEYHPGVSIDEANSKDLLIQDLRNKLGEDLIWVLLTELFVIDIMQSDPNPANFKLNLKEEKWILYDFGACLEIRPEIKKNYLDMIKALIDYDEKKILDIFIELGIARKDDPDKYLNILLEYTSVVAEVFKVKEFNWAENDLESKLIKLGRKLLFNFPRSNPPFQTVFVDRKISGTFYLLRKIKAKTKNNKIFKEFFELYGLD